MRRNLSGHNVLAPVPGILIIDIGGHIIAFHLDMGGDPDVRPLPAVKRDILKPPGGILGPLRIGKFPEAVQGKAQRGRNRCAGRFIRACRKLLFIREKHMVRVGREAVLLKDLRIRDNSGIKTGDPLHPCPQRGDQSRGRLPGFPAPGISGVCLRRSPPAGSAFLHTIFLRAVFQCAVLTDRTGDLSK